MTEQMEIFAPSGDTMPSVLKHAIQALREGRIILLLDSHERENEGDLIVAAEKITPESMNFLIKRGSGIVCITLPKERLDYLALPPMIQENTNSFQTAFTVSIEARHGVTTGVSARDRAHTIQTVMSDQAKSSDLARPGHVFPLAAQDGGVFSRMGHTEGSVDLVKIAGLKPGAVLCELMNEDGSMTMGEDRKKFAESFGIPVISVEDVLYYRIAHENIVSITKKIIPSFMGNLIWQRCDFFEQYSVDVWVKPDLSFQDSTAQVSLVFAENIVNRYLSHVLTNDQDDPLVHALSEMNNNNSNVVIMVSGHKDKNSPDEKPKIHAIICRALRELGITRIAKNGLNKELLATAQQYFSISLCEQGQ